jgi:competence protein ComEC
MVLDLRLGRWGFLFTGDLEALGENLLLQGGRLLAATVLKVPHHGSITSSTERFIEAVHPSFAVISDGYNNRYHFPSALVVNRYRTEGARLLRTDQSGAIGFQAQGDGLRLWTRWATP